VARGLALAASIAASLLAVSGAGGASGAPLQTPKRGGTVVVGVPSTFEPVCFNAALAVCWAGGNLGFLHILDGLVLARPFEVAAGAALRPDLVSHVTVRKEPFTLTYHIREDARWSDGVPVTARDFALTYRFIRGSDVFPDHPFRDATATSVDARTFRLTFGRRLSATESRRLFPPVVPSHALRGEDLSSPDLWRETVVNPRTGAPIGSGPFVMASRERGRRITLVRNPRYREAEKPYLARLVFSFLPADELADALRNGRVDLVLPGTAPANAALQEVRRAPAPGVRVTSVPSTGWEHLDIRVGPGGHPALRSKLVRRALAYALDREALVRTLEERVYGRSTPRLSPLESVVFLPLSRFYEPNWRQYRYRPREARRLLDRAGCRMGADGIRVCSGERLSLRVGTTAGAEWRRVTLELLQAQLRRQGIEVVLQYLPGVGVVARALESGNLDLGLYAWVTDGLPSDSAIFKCGGALNFTGHCSRLVTRELDNADRVLDEASQARAMNRADRLLARDVPVIPLYQQPSVRAYRAGLRNVDVTHPTNLLWNAEDWWVDR